MTIKKIAFLLGSMAMAFALSGATCGGDEDGCVGAKEHMCSKILDMGCFAGFMGDAQQKIIDACGQDELDAYVPVLESACSVAETSGTTLNCGAIAGKTYAGPTSGAGGTCDAGTKSFSYSGTRTGDGRPAQLSFTVSGTSVTGGNLYATGVCETSIRLTTTSVSFTGVLSGSWESTSGSISATWTGGDSVCGTQLTAAEGYPTSGSLTIRMAGGKVVAQRMISGAEPYEFSPSGAVYTPPSATCGTTPADAGSGTLGPVCTKLAACCPTITDIPALQSDCYTTLSNGLGDSGCQITWNSLTRLGYCAGI